LFRLAPVKERIGYFDTVRKAADTEYIKRIQVAFGSDTYLDMPDVLSIYRLGSNSLSRSDFRPGWRHPARFAYQNAYTYWHALIEKGLCSPYRTDSIEDRPFPAPSAFA